MIRKEGTSDSFLPKFTFRTLFQGINESGEREKQYDKKRNMKEIVIKRT